MLEIPFALDTMTQAGADYWPDDIKLGVMHEAEITTYYCF